MANESENSRELASREHWSQRWAAMPVSGPEFNPGQRNFRDLHALYKKLLLGKKGLRFLELGCYPGRYLWYFWRYFGCEVSGLEYLEWCADKTRVLLTEHGVPARIIHADIFDYQPPEDEPLWDIVASFGLVEHFSDGREALRAHLRLTRPGGIVFVQVPNFQGLYGRIMKWAAPEDYPVHRIMSLEELAREFESAGAVEIVEAGYYGRLGLNHTGLHQKLRKISPLLWYLGRAAVFALELCGQLLQPGPRFSPYIAVAARKK